MINQPKPSLSGARSLCCMHHLGCLCVVLVSIWTHPEYKPCLCPPSPEPLNLNLGSGRSPAANLGAVVHGVRGFVACGDGESGGSHVGDVDRSLIQWPHRRLSYPPTPRSGPASLEQWSSTDSATLSTSSPSLSSSSQISHWRMYRDMYGNPLFATCSKCGGKYTNPNVCASHETKCNGSNRLMCHICKRVYSQMCALKEHLRGKHGLGEMLKCKLCERSFKYKPQLYDHACAGLKKDNAAISGSSSGGLSQ